MWLIFNNLNGTAHNYIATVSLMIFKKKKKKETRRITINREIKFIKNKLNVKKNSEINIDTS